MDGGLPDSHRIRQRPFGNEPKFLEPHRNGVSIERRRHSDGSYYAVLAHELTHWTGAKARLDRDLSGRFGSEAYAMEELVAELGAAFLSGQLGLPSVPRTDHAPYIATWLKVLKNDSRAIFTAASKAQAAADYLAGFQTVEEEMAA